jgi:hypothetical protein
MHMVTSNHVYADELTVHGEPLCMSALLYMPAFASLCKRQPPIVHGEHDVKTWMQPDLTR